MLEESIDKAIHFFREFKDKSNSDLYRRAVLKFCNLVEEYKTGKKVFDEDLGQIKMAKDIFGVKEEN